MPKLLIRISLPALVFLCLISSPGFGQLSEIDLMLIANQDVHEHQYDPHKVKYLFADSESKFVKYNPLSLAFGSVMLFYQAAVSPQFAAGCLYENSCSNFSKSLISEYGLLKGICTSADRLTRCTKLSTIDVNKLKINTETGKVIEDVKLYKMKK
ncbi:MAG: membrane protein insertion efficiency factor YidD [Bacteroidetes bacterium]|nr:membrane protein insertion efficiency factor YidD [Bacteroidota bacterium]